MTEQIMRQMFGGPAGGRGGKRNQAQDLAYQAMEAADAGDAESALRLALDAVKLDSHCLDALTILAQVASKNQAELIEAMRAAVAAGEEDFGPSFFAENRGYFWGVIETRPYMRGRAYLAQLLLETGRIGEAAHEYEELLKLNPNDNQGLRYPLLGCYLASGNLSGAERLFAEHADEESAVFAWGRVLERYVVAGPDEAQAALGAARNVNSHAEKYLSGRKPSPDQLPAYYGMGDENEAVMCANAIGDAWQRNPAAVQWLKSVGWPVRFTDCH